MIVGVASDIEHILEAGNSAPSGENCQPWHFVLRAGNIEIHLLPKRDQSPYSWGQRASYLGCGAAIENISVAASAEGYRAEIQYLPDSSDLWHVATITLTKASGTPDPLTTVIAKRISNRKPYKTEALSEAEKSALTEAVSHAGYGTLALIENRPDIEVLGRVGSTNEEIMLANRSLHDFFFGHVSWTKEEDEMNKIGFYIKTLELPPPAQAMFKLFRNWGTMRLFNMLGFNRIVAKQNAATNAAAAAIGALSMEATEPIDFIKIGRTVERLWLTATSLGLSFQPLTGVLFFKLKIVGGEEAAFSSYERGRIMDAYEDAARICKTGQRHIAFLFRVGWGDAPSAHAIRFPLVEAVTVS